MELLAYRTTYMLCLNEAFFMNLKVYLSREFIIEMFWDILNSLF